MSSFTGETAFTGAKYLEAETNSRVVETYFQLSQAACSVNRAQSELEETIASNKNNWEKNYHLHRAEVVASRGADFERAFAKYHAIELMFVELAYEAGVNADEVLDLVSVARKGR